ncbi:MAG: galactokinase [Halapricum sp.]
MNEEYAYHVISPGRVNLIGEHTDYSGGYVLPVATDLHTELRAAPTDDETVTVTSAAFDEQRTFTVDDTTRTSDWADYLKGCYAVLRKEGYAPGGFRGKISGTLPLGSGLSSSASLELAVLGFLNDAYDLGLSRERLALLGQRVENDFVGVSCGIMDQFAVALTRANHALHLDTETLQYDHVPVPDEVQILVYHTGVERALVDSEYNHRRGTVEAGLDALNADTSKDVDPGDLETLSDRQRRRLGFVHRENERVQEATAALSEGDVERVGELLVTAHEDIATNYEASCEELDFFVDVAVDEGAYGARLTGAGWGGAAVALVDRSRAERIANAVHERYEQQYPEHDSRFFLVSPSGGVAVDRTA